MNKHIHATVLTLLCSAGLVYASDQEEQKRVPRMGICQGGDFVYIQGSSRPYTPAEFLLMFPQSLGSEESTNHSSSTTCPISQTSGQNSRENNPALTILSSLSPRRAQSSSSSSSSSSSKD